MTRPIIFLRVVLYALVLFTARGTHAQDSVAVQVERTIKPAVAADLDIAQRPIIRLRAEVLGNSPARRVAGIHERLDDLLERQGPCVLSTAPMLGGHTIMMDGAPFMYISALDIDPTEGEEMATVLPRTLERLKLSIGEYREMRDSRAMMRHILFVLLYTAAFFVTLYLLDRLRRWIRGRAEALIQRGIEHTGIKGGIPRAEGIFLLAQRLAILVIGALMLVSTYFWLTAVFERIPITRAWGDQMYTILSRVGLWILHGLIEALPGLGMVLFIIMVTRWVVNAFNALLTRIQNRELELGWLDPMTAAPTKRIISIVLWLFALTLAYPYIPGSDSGAFKGVSVLAGIMLSLGSSSVVAQAASGLVLMYNRRIRPGEYVTIDDHVTGTVQRIGYFDTVVLTGYQEEVSVPNSAVLSSKVSNFSRHGGKGIVFTTGVTIGYDAPWRQVHAMLLEAAARTGTIASDPAPVINQHALNDFFVDYRITVVIDGRVRPTLTQLHAAILDVFNENGVQIMSPHYEGDPLAPKVVKPEEQDPAIRWSRASPTSSS